MGVVYRASTLKRNRRTNDQLEQLDQQIIDVLTEDHPQSVRHVFYRMTDLRFEGALEAAKLAEESERSGIRMLAMEV